MPSSPTVYDYNEVDDFIYEARAVKARPPPHQPFATRLKRDMTMDRYLAQRIFREASVSEDPTELYPRVEFSLNKKKRWEQVRALQESIYKDNTGSKALVTFCTPYRGSLWWYRTLGVVNLNKMNDRLLSDAAVKGKAKNMTLISQCVLDSQPVLEISVVRCYNDTHYSSQTMKGRRKYEHRQRGSSLKCEKKLWNSYDDDDL